jgi:DNA-binding CsgD family transcriptional regulator/PAS domain-containing protein
MHSIRANAAETVLGRFFEAAVVPELWPKALQGLAEACGAEGAAVNAIDGLRTHGTVGSDALLELYQGFITRWRAPELNSHRARGLALIRRGWRGVLTEQDCFTPEELARDPFHQEYFMRSGFSSFAGAILAKGPGLMMSVSINRRPSQGEYTRGEVALISKLVDQLRAAGEVAVRVGIESNRRIADSLGATGHPIALLDRDGCVLHMNARFERLVADGVQIKSGRLGSWHDDADRRLAAAVHKALRHDGALRDPFSAVVLPRRNGGRALVARIVPVVGRAHDILHLASAIVTLTDLDVASSVLPESLLEQAFSLTPAEARLAAEIGAGRSLPEIARATRISHETLRSRLKVVFDKTGTARQTDLALLVAKFARPPP